MQGGDEGARRRRDRRRRSRACASARSLRHITIRRRSRAYVATLTHATRSYQRRRRVCARSTPESNSSRSLLRSDHRRAVGLGRPRKRPALEPLVEHPEAALIPRENLQRGRRADCERETDAPRVDRDRSARAPARRGHRSSGADPSRRSPHRSAPPARASARAAAPTRTARSRSTEAPVTDRQTLAAGSTTSMLASASVRWLRHHCTGANGRRSGGRRFSADAPLPVVETSPTVRPCRRANTARVSVPCLPLPHQRHHLAAASDHAPLHTSGRQPGGSQHRIQDGLGRTLTPSHRRRRCDRRATLSARSRRSNSVCWRDTTPRRDAGSRRCCRATR